MAVDIESLSGPRVTCKACIAAAIACFLVIVAGAIVLNEQLRLARLAHVAIDEDAVHSLWANRVVVSALQCRRYEKDSFLNLNDEPTRADYVQKWTKSWDSCTTTSNACRRLTSHKRKKAEGRQLCRCWRTISAALSGSH